MNSSEKNPIYLRILKRAGRLLERLGRLITRAGSSLISSESSERQEIDNAWCRDNGDKTFRVEYDLNENSLVFDIGGYEGQWSSDIFSRYSCLIHIFEPVDDFASKIDIRFAKNMKIVLHRFGLSDQTVKKQIYMDKDATSMFRVTPESKEISLVKAIDFLEESGISKIDLIKINIEGGEYDLLNHLLDCGFAKQITDIQVQFHAFVPDAERRMLEIQRRLKETHFLTYQYLFVWENWRKK
jgi:FkbM family methyltransferase